ncbi:ADP-ribosylglycohydrolase family protein [Bradyrhizobium sp. AUGA SZCCT0274]|uniref:ADP-ribosylglycohydrolase family protein n=1 Tax=Bradyrhizobium sp. AUGA SZCCT0274 TaxID=2807670 RepID=UPI001BA93800|nr:ADP-ribosylglycohydrolase family protein [Bradyrhizobium sp. AUGA SZCCT0274]
MLRNISGSKENSPLSGFRVSLYDGESAPWNDPAHTNDLSRLACRSASGPHAESQRRSGGGRVATVAEGGDSDTNAAVCGALLGAAHGREAVPLQWRNAVLTCRPVRADCQSAPRPMTYWPDDALELAEALVSARQVRSVCQ